MAKAPELNEDGFIDADPEIAEITESLIVD